MNKPPVLKPDGSSKAMWSEGNLAENIAYLINQAFVFKILVLNAGKLLEQAPLFSGQTGRSNDSD